MRRDIIFDTNDLIILRTINEGRYNMGYLKEAVGLSYPNLLVHLKRIEKMIVREREKQTIWISLSPFGKKVLEAFAFQYFKEEDR